MTSGAHRRTPRSVVRHGRRLLFAVAALVLAGGAAAFAYWTVTVLYAPTNYAIAQADALSAPTAATATITSGTAVTVGWTLPAGQLSGAAYQVARTSPGNTVVCTVTAPTTSCPDTGLTPGTAYTYAVTSVLDSWVSTAAPAAATTLAITTTSLPAADANVSYTVTPTAIGGAGPYSWSLAGTLPVGLTFNTTTGQISGTPTAVGTAADLILTVIDSNGAQTSSGPLSITINAGPIVTTTTLATATDGQPYSQTLTSSGGTGAITWSVSAGSLPTGLTLNTGSGVISGTLSLTAVTQTFSVIATDATNVASPAKSLTISVNTVPAQPPVALHSAGNFALLAGTGITNTNASSITGDVGSSPTASETGFSSVAITGTNHFGDSVTVAAKNDLATAYADAASRAPSTGLAVAGALGGLTLAPGAYNSVAISLAGTVTLDGQGNSNAEFIFQSTSTLITAASSQVVLINGANACHVVWQVGSSVTFGAGTQFLGDVLVYTSVTDGAGTNVQGRVLAEGGAVTMDSDTINNSGCVAPIITTSSLASATDGQTGYTQTLASMGGTSPILWNVSTGSLPTGLTINAATGVISGTVGIHATTQTFTVVATDVNGLASLAKTLTITVNPGAPTIIAVSSGGGQSATVNTAFSSPLVALVTDSLGNPVPGVIVTFTPAVSGASGTFAGGVNTATTNGSGLATSAAFTANTTAGAYNVAAAIGAGSVNFSETNNSGAANKFVITTAAVSGTASSSPNLGPITVQEQDQFGNPTTTAETITPTSTSTGTKTFATTVNGSAVTTVSITAGQSSTSFFYGDTKSGSPTLTVSGALLQAQQVETITTGAAQSIAISSGSGQSATVNTAFSSPLVGLVTDSFGNPVSGVMVTFTPPGTGTSGAFAGGVNTATTNASGLATSAALTANTTAGAYNVAAVIGAGSVNFSETNNPGAAAKLVFTTQPVAGVAEGTSFPTPPTVKVEDANNNVVTTDTGTITLAKASGPATGTLTCTNPGYPTVTAVAGAVTFTGCEITGAGAAGTYTLSATRSLLTTATSSSVVIIAGLPVQLIWTNLSVTAGSVAPTSGPTAIWNHATILSSLSGHVSVVDAYGNIAQGIGTGHTVHLVGNGLLNGVVSPSTLTLASSGPATSTGSFSNAIILGGVFGGGVDLTVSPVSPDVYAPATVSITN